MHYALQGYYEVHHHDNNRPLTWQLGDFRSHNRTVLSSDPVRNVSLTGDICSATTLCDDDVMCDYVIMTSSVVYKTTTNIEHEMKASKYYLASNTTSTRSELLMISHLLTLIRHYNVILQTNIRSMHGQHQGDSNMMDITLYVTLNTHYIVYDT